MPPTRISRVPLHRKLLPVLIIFLSITLVSLLLTFIALGIQSAVRSYVAGEGLWSKAQRDAVFLLERYGLTGDPQYLQRFERALAIPLGDRTARTELQKPDYEPAVATRGFLEGGNHPDDIPGLIMLFRCCAELPYISKAIKLWTQGDEQVAAMQEVARDLTRELASPPPSPARIQALLKRLENVNNAVHPLEAEFTATLGDVARLVTRLLFLTTSAIILLLIALGIYLSWRILNSIRESEERYRVMLNSANDALVVVDRATGAILQVNPKAEQLLGRRANALIGGAYGDFLPDPLGRTGHTVPAEEGRQKVVRHSVNNVLTGRVIPVEVSYSTTEWGNHPVHFAIIRDISERVQAERDLRVAANAMAHMAEGVVITDAHRRVVSVNRAYTAITGYEQADVLGRVQHYPVSRQSDVRLYRSMWKTARKTGYWEGEIWSERKNGEVFPALLSVSAVRDEQGRTTHYVGVFNDIAAQKEYERRLHHLAHHDPLTQLPNRAAFESICTNALEKALATGSALALLFIDLDGFKLVNDTYGHAAGDALLGVIGDRLRACVRSDDSVARVGGDEFTILLQGITDQKSAERVAKKILTTLSDVALCVGHSISASASIGISLFPADATDMQTMMTHADTAMYEAKNRGRNNYQFFAISMALEASSRLVLTHHLKQAIANNEFELHYQPCVDMLTGLIVGMEALLRWNCPELGNVSPSTFIPVAEEIGVIHAIGEWVLEEACRQGEKWHIAGIMPPGIAVNMSPHSFWDPELPARIGAVLASTGFSADWLCLEITESTLMSQERSEEVMRKLHTMGIRLAIDDFGVGYSSLSYLKHLPVQYLKIDRCFTQNIPRDRSNLAIVKTIIALGKNMGLRIIAEGVETLEQYHVLKNEGCDEGQGYFFARPLPAWEVEKLLRNKSPWRPPEDNAIVQFPG